MAGKTVTGTLSAGVAADIDLKVGTCRSVQIHLENTGGTNAIGTVNVFESPDGANFAEDTAAGTAIGSVAASTKKPIVRSDADGLSVIRIRLTSSSGTTYKIVMNGR